MTKDRNDNGFSARDFQNFRLRLKTRHYGDIRESRAQLEQISPNYSKDRVAHD